MATIEELLNLSDKGWEDIALMTDAELQIYLNEIFLLENKIKTSTIYKNKDENKSIGDDDSSSDDDSLDSGDDKDDALSELKKSTEDPDSPFDKRKKYKKKTRKILSTYDIDLEAEKLKQELGLD